MNIFIGSLSFRTEENELRELFENFGEVSSVSIISDKYTGKSRGFGFIDMPNDSEAIKAIGELNGADFGGRAIAVKEAVARERDNNRDSHRPRRDNYR